MVNNFPERVRPDGGRLLFVLNHSSAQVRIELPDDSTWRDLLSGASVATVLELETTGVAILAKA